MDEIPESAFSLADNPLLIGYLLGVGIISLWCCATLLQRLSKPLNRASLVRSWQIGWIDFFLFLWIALCWIVLSQAMADLIPGMREARESAEATPIWVLLTTGLIMQGGLILFFVVYRVFFWQLFQSPVNPRPHSYAAAFSTGLFHFLAFLPLVWLVGAAWTFLAFQLRDLGINIPIKPQDTVGFIQDSHNPWELLGMMFLAVVMAPIAEELIFRAGIYRFLKSRWRGIFAMLISSAFFALAHGHIFSFPSLLVVGIFLCLSYEWSGDIKVPIFFHGFFNLNSIVLILMQRG